MPQYGASIDGNTRLDLDRTHDALKAAREEVRDLVAFAYDYSDHIDELACEALTHLDACIEAINEAVRYAADHEH